MANETESIAPVLQGVRPMTVVEEANKPDADETPSEEQDPVLKDRRKPK